MSWANLPYSPLFLGCEHEGGQFWIFEYSFEK